MRPLALALLAAAAVLAACDEKPGSPPAGGTLVSFTDSTQCATSPTIFRNLTGDAKDVQVKVHNGCLAMDDTIHPSTPAHVYVADSAGHKTSDALSVDYGKTESATFSVPKGQRIDLACPGIVAKSYGCTYTYSYVMH